MWFVRNLDTGSCDLSRNAPKLCSPMQQFGASWCNSVEFGGRREHDSCGDQETEVRREELRGDENRDLDWGSPRGLRAHRPILSAHSSQPT